MFHYMFRTEFVTLVGLKVPSGGHILRSLRTVPEHLATCHVLVTVLGKCWTVGLHTDCTQCLIVFALHTCLIMV